MDRTPVVGSGFGAMGEIGSATSVDRENPARTSEMVGTMATCTATELDAVVGASAVAQREWAQRSLDERVGLLRRAADAVDAAADKLAPLLARELGKPLEDSAGEMRFAAAFSRFVADRAASVLAPIEIDDDAGRVRVTREPFGVVAAIVPWNAPLILSSLKVAPAVACGNTIVVKPSPLAPFAVTAALSIMAAELPPGVISVVHGDAEVGQRLVGHPLVRKVAFTGGEAVGRSVLRATAEMITPTVMELGGNDPAIVLDDLSFSDRVMERLVFGAFLTSGQVCMAAKRIYVPTARLDEFAARFADAADRVLVVGDPLDPSVTVGPMVSAAHRDRVAEMVEESVSLGATVRELGSVTADWDPAQGYFLRPTVVTGLANDARIVATEQFGPTVPVIGYDTVDDAIAMANDSDLGLASSVWSDDEDLAFEVGRRIEAGMTFINCHNRAGMSLRVPFGGVKRSGFGREFGDAGIAEYTQSHAIHRPASARGNQDGNRGGNRTPNDGGRAYPI